MKRRKNVDLHQNHQLIATLPSCWSITDINPTSIITPLWQKQQALTEDWTTYIQQHLVINTITTEVRIHQYTNSKDGDNPSLLNAFCQKINIIHKILVGYLSHLSTDRSGLTIIIIRGEIKGVLPHLDVAEVVLY